MFKPRIFISAASSELGEARKLVEDELRKMGYEPVHQPHFGTEYGDLHELLRRKIDRCQGLFHLVGYGYGMESPLPYQEFTRVSYTQYEFLYASRETRKKTWVIQICDGCTRPAAETLDQTEGDKDSPAAKLYQAERKARQQEWVNHLNSSSHVWYKATSDAELLLKIRQSKDEFAVLRRSTWALWTIALMLLFAMGTGILSIKSNIRSIENDAAQNQVNLLESLQRIEAQAKEEFRGGKENVKIKAKTLEGSGLATPLSSATPLLDQELRRAAMVVATNGTDSQKVIALILLEEFEKADAIIRDHREELNPSGEERMAWLVMDARSRLQQGHFRQAFDLYTEALDKAPDDIGLRIERIEMLLKPLLGFRIPRDGGTAFVLEGNIPEVDRVSAGKPTGVRGAFLKRFAEWDPGKGLEMATAQIALVLSLPDPSLSFQETRAFLQYRLGVCLQLSLRSNRTPNAADTKTRRKKAIESYGAAAELFRGLGINYMVAESLHQQAVVRLSFADALMMSTGDHTHLETAQKIELEASMTLAVDTLLDAEEAAIQDASRTEKLRYAIRMRLAHALIRQTKNQPDNLRLAKTVLKQAKSLNLDGHFDTLGEIYLETWLHQRLAEYEDKKTT